MCEFCKSENILSDTNESPEVYIDGKNLVIDYDCSDDWYAFFMTIDIEFCPKCGEKLSEIKENHEGEINDDTIIIGRKD